MLIEMHEEQTRFELITMAKSGLILEPIGKKKNVIGKTNHLAKLITVMIFLKAKMMKF